MFEFAVGRASLSLSLFLCLHTATRGGVGGSDAEINVVSMSAIDVSATVECVVLVGP